MYIIELTSKWLCQKVHASAVLSMCVRASAHSLKSIESGYIVDNLLVSLEVESSIKLSAFTS